MARKCIALLPFVLILAFILLFFLSGSYHLLNFETIQQEHLKWKAFVNIHPLLSSFYFVGIYTLSVLLVIPAATILTILGGFLFPMPLAVVYACVSETIGGMLFFLAARLASNEILKMKKMPRLMQMEKKFQADQACYLLFLRFSHLFPFWLINLGAGVFQVRVWTLIWTTCIGVLPFTYFLVEGGSTLSKYFETHAHFTMEEFFTTKLKILLIVLACTALLPIAYKKFKTLLKKRGKRNIN